MRNACRDSNDVAVGTRSKCSHAILSVDCSSCKRQLQLLKFNCYLFACRSAVVEYKSYSSLKMNVLSEKRRGAIGNDFAMSHSAHGMNSGAPAMVKMWSGLVGIPERILMHCNDSKPVDRNPIIVEKGLNKYDSNFSRTFSLNLRRSPLVC